MIHFRKGVVQWKSKPAKPFSKDIEAGYNANYFVVRTDLNTKPDVSSLVRSEDTAMFNWIVMYDCGTD